MSKKKKIILIICASILILGLVSGLLYLFLEYLPEKREKKEMERLVKEYYAAKYVKYAEENERYGDYEVDVAFIGDSLTDGYDLEKYYPEVLSNDGVSGADPIPEPSTKVDAVEYNKYAAAESTIVYEQYSNGKTFVLNFNNFAVKVKINGVFYTVSAYGYIEIK